MATIEKLREASMKAQNALHEAEAIERDKYNKTMIGRCFKYRNSGGGCDEKWWLYAKVIGAKDGHLRVFKFERLPNGHIMIEPDQFSYSGKMDSVNSGYTEIEHAELRKAWDAMFGVMAAFPV